MINARGFVVVLITSAISVALGYTQADRAWHADWTRLSSTGMICKGDKLK